MFMFNECHIHSCDCTWLNVFSHAQSLLIKHKKIFEYFSWFWNVFCFCKKVKNFKTMLPCFGNSVAGWSSCMSQSQAHTEIFRGSLASQYPSHEKYLEYFSKFRFLMLLASLATCLRLEGSVARRLRDFRGLPRDSLTGRTFSRKNHLDKFFKIFVLSVMATGPSNLLTTWLSRENCMFCTNWSVFKCFQFSLEHFCDCSLSSSFQTSLKLTVSLSNELPYLLLFILKSSRKRYGFSLSHCIFLVLSFVFLDLWFVSEFCDIYGFGYRLGSSLLSLGVWTWLILFLGCLIWFLSCFISLLDFITWSMMFGNFHTHVYWSHCHMIFFCDIHCLWVFLDSIWFSSVYWVIMSWLLVAIISCSHECCFCLEDTICSVLVWTYHNHLNMSHRHIFLDKCGIHCFNTAEYWLLYFVLGYVT